MRIKLLPHNQKAYENVKNIFKKRNRAAVIHPTGTGKGHIARKLIEDNQDKKIIYLSPSLAINNRLEEDFEKYGINGENVEILTYQKLTRMTKEEIEQLQADYIILDEFHHCGAREWGSVVNNLLDTHVDSKVLGLSATPLRYTNNGVRDMAEELFENGIASEMSLEAAIAEGILNEPTYVTSLYAYEELISDLEKKINEYDGTGNERKSKRKEMAKKEFAILKKHVHEALTSLPDILKKSMPNKNGKYIVFCSSIEDMKKKIEAAPELFKKVNTNIEIRQVSSDEADVNKNEKTLQEFAEDKNPNSLKLLFCVNMLNEGYHLEDLDGGIMMRATASPTLYTQQFGRIVSAGKKGETVLIDLVNNIDAIENIVRFYDNLSRERSGKRKNDKAKKFTMTRELRNVSEIVRKIESLVSRRANNIEVNFLNRLGISYDEAKAIIENHADELNDGRSKNYDGEDVLAEKDTLNLFYQLRKSKMKLATEIEAGTPTYNKKKNDYNQIRDEIIVKNMGLVRWMLKNIPELQPLEFETEEDKEQAAMKYLIEAVDTYNPKLRTRDNSSLRFDQYLLVFIQTGMIKETKDYEYEVYTAEIFEIKAQLEEEYGREHVTDEMIAEVILDRTLEAMESKSKDAFKKHPLYSVIRDEIIKCRDQIVQRNLIAQSYLKREYKTKASVFRKNAEKDLFSKWNSDERKRLIEITKFHVRAAYTKFQSIGNYNEIADFDIQEYDFEDGERLEGVGEAYISEGVYLEKKEPVLRETGADELYQQEIERAEKSFLKVDLESVLKTLTERGERVIRLKYGLGLNKEDVEGGEKLVKNYDLINKTLRHLRHPSRARVLKNYGFEGNNFRLTRKPIGEKDNKNIRNFDDSISYDVASGDLENIKLSEIIDSEELYAHLNEAGLWCLNDLVQITEEQLRSNLQCSDEFVDDIKRILSGYGLELSEDEQQDLSLISSGDDSKKSKVRVLKGLMKKRQAQEEEIADLKDAIHDNQSERED